MFINQLFFLKEWRQFLLSEKREIAGKAEKYADNFAGNPKYKTVQEMQESGNAGMGALILVFYFIAF